jgi:hypothetical protein
MTEQGVKKRKLKDENRSFHSKLENDYFIKNNSGKLQCLFVCK